MVRLEEIPVINWFKAEPNNWAKEAGDYCKQYHKEIKVTNLGGDEFDAFRHAYIQMRMTYKYGDKFAKFIGDNHEDFTGNNLNEKRQDLYNNEVARRHAVKVGPKLNGTMDEEKIRKFFLDETLKLLKQNKLIKNPSKDKRDLKDLSSGRDQPTGKAADIKIDPNAEAPSLAKDPYVEQLKNKPSGTQNPYTHPDVNYDPTQRIYNRNGQILKPASTQGNQPPVASKPFGRQPIYQSPNNAAIATTLGSVGGAGAAVAGVLYKEAAAGAAKVTLTVTGEIVKDTGTATGYAASMQGASAWSAATNAVSSAWSAAATAIGNVVSWVGGAISTMAGAVASAAVAVAGAIATAVTAAASAIGGAIASAIAWIAALAFPW